jgi:hypothetical protein
MDKRKRRRFVLLLVSALVVALIPLLVASAQTGGSYDLTWNAVAGGGQTFSAGGGYTLGGAIGQAGVGRLTGGGYVLVGGLWAGLPLYAGYLPMLRK